MPRRTRPSASFAWFAFAALALCVHFTWHQFKSSESFSDRSQTRHESSSQNTRSSSREHQPEETFEARVVAVADGDSLVVQRNDARSGNADGETRIRLEGIDAPEFGQPFHRQAKKFLSDACLGKVVIVQPYEKDRYGRLVGRVFLNHANATPNPEYDLSRQLLQNGMAWHFLRYNTDPDFAAAEREARSRRIGLWQDPNAVAPWDWRDQSMERKRTERR